MGISDFIKKKNNTITSDYDIETYEKWLDFLSKGGTTKEFEKYCSVKPKTINAYESEINDIFDKYIVLMNHIQKEWSAIYRSNVYTGEKASSLELDCLTAISYYNKIHKIDIKYNKATPQNCPPYKRLAMLYEKQGNFEKSVSICTSALLNGAYGDGMCKRLVRMIKKANRIPTLEEEYLINQYKDY